MHERSRDEEILEMVCTSRGSPTQRACLEGSDKSARINKISHPLLSNEDVCVADPCLGL
jgi:hypothetical protein